MPTFQRPQVWNISQVIDFLDSVYRRYPVGSLLFWLTTSSLQSERNLGGFRLPETPERFPRNYVLDGQQRLTALYALLTQDPTRAEDRFKVVFDLKEQEFVELKGELGSYQVPLNILKDPSRFLAFQDGLRELPDSEASLTEAQRLWETFQNYVIPVVTLFEVPIDEVGVIFERINSRGTRLTIFDLMVAATWSVEGPDEFNLRSSFGGVLEQLAEKDYSDVDPVTVLRCLSVVATGSARRQSILSLRERDRTELQLLIETTRSALALAVDFLVSETSVVSSDFLPYERQLVLLTYVMAKRPSLSSGDVDVLRRWFWRTSFAERYRTGGEALFDEDLTSAISGLDGEGDMSRFGDPPDKSFFTRSQFRKGAAGSQAFAALLGSRNPQNLTNAASIDVGTSLSAYNRKEFHHLFPQKFLKDVGVDSELINTLANICMLSSSENKRIGSEAPSEYIAHLRGEHGDQFDEVMASNLVPPSAVDRMLSDDYPGFLEARAEHLCNVVSRLV